MENNMEQQAVCPQCNVHPVVVIGCTITIKDAPIRSDGSFSLRIEDIEDIFDYVVKCDGCHYTGPLHSISDDGFDDEGY